MPEAEISLHDRIAEAMGQHSDEPAQEPAPTPADSPAPEPAQEPAQEATGRTANRLRDERGRLLPGKSEDSPPQVASPAKAATDAAQQPPASGNSPAEVEPPKSWKREMWDAYKRLDPATREYVKEREEQLLTGLTGYRQQVEATRDIAQVVQAFDNDFRMAGVTPAQGLQRLAETHRAIRAADPMTKVQIFQRLAEEYGVPLHAVQTGQVDPVTQYLTPLQQQVEELRAWQQSYVQQQEFNERSAMQTEIETLASTAEHFEEVRATMAGLLQSGLSPDLKTAYDDAIRMKGLAGRPQQSSAAVVRSARANAVSTRSATPTTIDPASGKRDVRSILEEAVPQMLRGARV